MSGVGNKVEAAWARSAGVVQYVVVSLLVLLVAACPVAIGTRDWSPVVAWALTMAPGAAIVARASSFADPRQSLPFLFYSMVFRVVVSLGGGFLLLSLFPALPRTPFLLWLAGLYFVALTVETGLTLSVNSWWMPGRPSPRGRGSSNQLQEAGR